MKDLLVIAKSLGGGGSEVALIEFLNHIDYKKYHVTLLLMDHDLEYEYRLKQKIPIRYIKFYSKIYHRLASMYSLSGKILKKMKVNEYFKIYDFIAKHADKEKKHYDLAIDFYGYGSFTTAYLALNVSATRKAFWIHDEKMPWIKNVYPYFDYFSSFCCVSESIKDNFIQLYPEQKSKAMVFYNVIDTDDIIKKSKEYYPPEFQKNRLNIVTVGRLTEQKGYDIAIKSAAMLRDKHIDFKWYAIGDGKDKNKLLKLIAKEHLSDCFILLGRRDNPYPYISNCDIFVLESRHEGYSVALVEARILNTLIITSSIPSNKEQIRDCFNGLIAKLTPTDLADTIYKLYKDHNLQCKLLNNIRSQKINFDNELNKLDNI